ncbi:AAA family ATPase, partial [Acinetobacter sp. UBA3132]
MKILRLSLNNLASLAGTHDICFDDSPLAHAGLIAITGKTGAGKSTLLDAMCLALYNEIPRLKGATGSLKDTGGQDVSIKDSKNILRRGTTTGFSELEFIALDSKRYLARWEIRRARNKIDGNLKVDRYIKCLDDDTTLTQKISEVTPLIEKLIGLSFEQFTRAVLLAQSEVGAFLKAKDHERADLLEYLTNSQIFSVVSQKAAQKFSEVKNKRSDLEKLIGHIETLSEEDINALKQQQTALSLQLQNLQQSEKLLENEKKWHLDRHKLYAEVHAKKEVYDVQLDAINKSAGQQQLLEQLDEFQSIRDQFIQRSHLEPKKIQIQQQQAQFTLEFETLKKRFIEEETKLVALEQQQQKFQQHLDQIKPHLEAGLKLDHAIHTVSEQYKKLNTEQNQFQTTHLHPLEQQLAQQQLALSHAQAKQQQISQQLTQSEFLSVFDQEPQSTLQRMQDYLQQYQQLLQKNPESLNQPLSALEKTVTELSAKLNHWIQ